jgi:hypothetical protein
MVVESSLKRQLLANSANLVSPRSAPALRVLQIVRRWWIYRSAQLLFFIWSRSRWQGLSVTELKMPMSGTLPSRMQLVFRDVKIHQVDFLSLHESRFSTSVFDSCFRTSFFGLTFQLMRIRPLQAAFWKMMFLRSSGWLIFILQYRQSLLYHHSLWAFLRSLLWLQASG